MFFGFEIKSVLLNRRRCLKNCFCLVYFLFNLQVLLYLLQHVLEFLQIFPNPLAVVLPAVLKSHGSCKLVFWSLLEICVHCAGDFRKVVCSSHMASENLFVAPMRL
jgi:hypothetical protein